MTCSEPLPDDEVDPGQPLTESTVLFSSHRLVPLAFADGTYGCQVEAPDGAQILIRLRGCPSAGDGLLKGQFWLMKSLKKTLAEESYKAPRLNRLPRQDLG